MTFELGLLLHPWVVFGLRRVRVRWKRQPGRRFEVDAIVHGASRRLRPILMAARATIFVILVKADPVVSPRLRQIQPRNGAFALRNPVSARRCGPQVALPPNGVARADRGNVATLE